MYAVAAIANEAGGGVQDEPWPLPESQEALQHPGAAEAKRIQAYSRQRDKHYNGVRLDVKKAHRRILVSEEDWGFQATDIDNDGTVQLNTVGTFGIASAGLWWQRTFALLCRLTFHFLGNAD